MKNIAVLFGGVSAEHEVSVITGLQVVEKMDDSKFRPLAIRLNQTGEFEYYKGLHDRGGFGSIKPVRVSFGHDIKGAFIQTAGMFREKIYIDAAYLAFHGGNGESGQIQGFLETLGIPYTSPNVETSAISMNKALTKEILSYNKLPVVDGISVCDTDIKKSMPEVLKRVEKELKFPVIIKPAHLGSSIGIAIVKNEAELKKHLLAAARVDTEMVIEKLVKKYVEYNVAVRKINSKIETSEVEKPISQDEILSFADKYERGGKKTGGGMASLTRELPAKISKSLEKEIKAMAKDVFKAIRAEGMVRIDFMYAAKKLYVTEINPIPGSMSYYLWEASGISFRDQITDMLVQAVEDFEDKKEKHLDYKTDIVEKFINSS